MLNLRSDYESRFEFWGIPAKIMNLHVYSSDFLNVISAKMGEILFSSSLFLEKNNQNDCQNLEIWCLQQRDESKKHCQ